MTISGGGLAAVTALLTTMGTVVAFLFRELMKAQETRYTDVIADKDEQIKRETARGDKWEQMWTLTINKFELTADVLRATKERERERKTREEA